MTFLYIDPSSMTYLIQIVVGVVIAAGAGVGFYWKRIRRYFRNKRREREDAAVEAQAAALEQARAERAAAGAGAQQPPEADACAGKSPDSKA